MQRIRVLNNKAVRDELAALAEKHGKLTEEIVVAASKSKKSALHAMFLWDDSDRAAHLGRLEIARQLIMVIRIEPHEQREINCDVVIRKYHGTGDGYKAIGDILTQSKLRAGLLNSALEDLQQLLRKYEALKELAPVRAAVESVLRQSKRAARKESREPVTV